LRHVPGNGPVHLAIYVDDLLLFTTTAELGDEIAAKLNAKFNCVDLGEITRCLGMYLTTIEARYEFEGLQSVPTPMLHDLKLTKEDCPRRMRPKRPCESDAEIELDRHFQNTTGITKAGIFSGEGTNNN
jgi:hypothetical protein